MDVLLVWHGLWHHLAVNKFIYAIPFDYITRIARFLICVEKMEREVSKIVPSFLASGIAYKSKTAVNNQWGRLLPSKWTKIPDDCIREKISTSQTTINLKKKKNHIKCCLSVDVSKCELQPALYILCKCSWIITRKLNI